ncbi:hypothetical protein [Mastigocoleus testarum]|uniref:hypothetical protein n=1 Tax=Mastigocoleus testarum TaxID=996925 RepID=UPI0004274C82|nr:hypothetical protein [Mastigocoleus testarum]
MIILTFIVAWIVFTILVKVVKTTVKLALTVAAIIVLLKIGFDISPFDVVGYVFEFLQKVSGAIENNDAIKDLIDTNN